MATHGYVTHAVRNRRVTVWLVFAYMASFQLLGAFTLTMPLLLFDHEHTILSDPLGYLTRYGLPLAGGCAFVFWRLYHGHSRAVVSQLQVRIVSTQEEPRFVSIAEEMCSALGVRTPRFGLIDVPEPNAFTVGEGPNNGLIAVTRGLLNLLDDDELAAVLAHEASHIRHGDTKLLAANHTLMRTANHLQLNNPLRFESWRQLIVPLLAPPMLPIMLAGNAATMMSLQLARAARRGLKLSRDHIADGEAVRATHFPEALITAIDKVHGKGNFFGSYRVESALFDGLTDREGGSHPSADDRILAIAELGHDLMDERRGRRDTRSPGSAQLGRHRVTPRTAAGFDREGRPLEQPPTRGLWTLKLYFTDREAFRAWERANTAWFEWRVSDRRNALGLQQKMIIPIAAVAAFLLVHHWPADGDLEHLAAKFAPAAIVDMARQTHSEPFCGGPSYRDGKCDSRDGSSSVEQIVTQNTRSHPTTPTLEAKPKNEPPGFSIFAAFPMLMLICIPFLKRKWLRRLFGIVEVNPSKLTFSDQHEPLARLAAAEEPAQHFLQKHRYFGQRNS